MDLTRKGRDFALQRQNEDDFIDLEVYLQFKREEIEDSVGKNVDSYHVPTKDAVKIREMMVLQLPTLRQFPNVPAFWMYGLASKLPVLDTADDIILFRGTSLGAARRTVEHGPEKSPEGEMGPAVYLADYSTAYRYACSDNFDGQRRGIVVCSLAKADIEWAGALEHQDEVNALIQLVQENGRAAAYSTNTPKNWNKKEGIPQVAVYDTTKLVVHGYCEVFANDGGYWPTLPTTFEMMRDCWARWSNLSRVN